MRITISMRTGTTKVMGAFRNFGKARKKTGTGNIVRKIKMSEDCGGQYQAKSTFTFTLTWKWASVGLRTSILPPPHSGLTTPTVTTTCTVNLSSG